MTTVQGFLQLGLSPRVLRALEAMGFEEPMPVQERVIPLMLAGKDVICQAQTGTGKTAAYGIPIAERVDPLRRDVQALVLCPTRELALQVSVHVREMGQFQGVVVLPIYGGQSYDHQLRALRRGVHVAVATPGRLLDLLDRRSISLQSAGIVIIDEADELLAMGFIEDVERILRQTPQERQTCLFSATMPDPIQRLAQRYMREPERVMLSPVGHVAAPAVEHRYYMVPREYKVEALVRLLDIEAPQLALVFCATKQLAADLGWEMESRGYRAMALHGDMTQGQRETVMEASRSGRVDVLVATDVAARGLDIPEVTHVINFDIPQDGDRYVHRIGRTGRAGRTGQALTLVSPREVALLKEIERSTGAHIVRAELPTVAEAEARERENLAARLEEVVREGKFSAFRPIVESLTPRWDPLDIAAAALSKAVGPLVPRQEIPQAPPERSVPPAAFRRGPRRTSRRTSGGRGRRRY